MKEGGLPFAIAPRRTLLEGPAEDAIAAFRAAAETHPDEPDYRFMLGEALLRAGRLAAAAVEMRAACAQGPPNAEYLASIGARRPGTERGVVKRSALTSPSSRRGRRRRQRAGSRPRRR